MAVKIIVGVLAAIAGYVAVSLWNPFGGGFDYATAGPEEKQKFLEARARHFELGYKLAAGKASEIKSRLVDAEYDLISFSVTLNDVGDRPVNANGAQKFRTEFLRMNCRIVERNLLKETDYTLRIRYFRKSGGKLFQIDVNGETCTPYIA